MKRFIAATLLALSTLAFAAPFTPRTFNYSSAGTSGATVFNGDITLDDGVGDSPSLIFIDADNKTMTGTKLDAGAFTWTQNEGAINLLPSADTDDYFSFNVTANVPTIATVGACNLAITASSGEITFADENLTTTGSITGASLTDGTATLTTGALTGLTTPLTAAQGGTGLGALSANVVTLLGAANFAAFKTSLSLNAVENTALSTWAGTTSITTAGALDTTHIDVDDVSAGGASNGPIIKKTFGAGETYSGTEAGLMVKAYDADATVTHGSSEYAGLALFFKPLSGSATGGEDMLMTLHQHASGNQTLTAGIMMYPKLALAGIAIRDCTLSYGLDLASASNVAVSVADIRGHEGEIIFNDPDGSWTLGGNVVIGLGAAGVDYTLTFDGETNDGVITWMEDEDQFTMACDLSVSGEADALAYSETAATSRNVSGAVEIDFTDGGSQTLVATGEVTSFTYANWPASGKGAAVSVVLDTNGQTITSVGLVTAGGAVIAWTADGIDILVFYTVTGSTTVYTLQSGADMTEVAAP